MINLFVITLLIVSVAGIVPLFLAKWKVLCAWVLLILAICGYLFFLVCFGPGDAPAGKAGALLLAWLLLIPSVLSCGLKGYILYQRQGGTAGQFVGDMSHWTKNVMVGGFGISLGVLLALVVLLTLAWSFYVFL